MCQSVKNALARKLGASGSRPLFRKATSFTLIDNKRHL